MGSTVISGRRRGSGNCCGKSGGVSLGATRVYDLLDEFGLSHQRDYGPAPPRQRAEFVAELKKTAQAGPHTAVVAMDEFALRSTTNTHYAWVERNTAPALPSDEKHRQKLNGFLAVDLGSGSTTVDFQTKRKRRMSSSCWP